MHDRIDKKCHDRSYLQEDTDTAHNNQRDTLRVRSPYMHTLHMCGGTPTKPMEQTPSSSHHQEPAYAQHSSFV